MLTEALSGNTLHQSTVTSQYTGEVVMYSISTARLRRDTTYFVAVHLNTTAGNASAPLLYIANDSWLSSICVLLFCDSCLWSRNLVAKSHPRPWVQIPFKLHTHAHSSMCTVLFSSTVNFVRINGIIPCLAFFQSRMYLLVPLSACKSYIAVYMLELTYRWSFHDFVELVMGMKSSHVMLKFIPSFTVD